MDLKALKSTLEQLETERGVPKEKIIETIEDALAAAYKKDYGKKGQIVRAKFNLKTGTTEFFQIKIVLDETMVKPETEEGEEGATDELEVSQNTEEGEIKKIRFNPERHIMLDEARKIKKDVKPEEEMVFSLETKEDYGRIAAQTGKQVIIQRIREAERASIYDEFKDKEGEVASGIIQRIEGGNIFLDLGRATAVLPREEQVWGERYRIGERIKALIFLVEQAPRGINIYLSRSHPRFLTKLFEMEVPEITSGAIEIKSTAREAGSRSKIAVMSNKEEIDPVGSCVGQKGVRVGTVISELGGEKIDIMEWSDDAETFIANALSPAKVIEVEIKQKGKSAIVTVEEDQVSLAIGKRGQNVRLAAKLTGWKLDIRSRSGESIAQATEKGKVTGKGVEPSR
ncbi:transcription termination factor NusA [Patescibacteria group bacterium]|nr:transcription termination factor NusA [Patescibacteria group bacterium]MBU2633160.1 transcription termination factor NusA [Patescibacteria group bacterium]